MIYLRHVIDDNLICIQCMIDNAMYILFNYYGIHKCVYFRYNFSWPTIAVLQLISPEKTKLSKSFPPKKIPKYLKKVQQVSRIKFEVEWDSLAGCK